ncbi:MAG: S8 family serine peptidase [Clostridium sp.]|nr:S8 family serine peptidase [Clostridium sp.]
MKIKNKKVINISIILLFLLCFLSKGHAFSKIYENNEKSKVRIIVELEDKAAIDILSNSDKAKDIESEVKNNQKDIICKAENITKNKIIKQFAYLVNGFSIYGSSNDIEKIKNISGVKDAYISYEMHESVCEKSNLISEINNEALKYECTGKGVVISIIDTGIDINNENLQNISSDNLKITKEKTNSIINEIGRGKYVSDKIPFAYNYADGDLNLYNSSEIHGMHVTGIAAANGEDFSGVAPNAQILAMKVKSSYGGGFYSEDLLLAIEDSVKLKADIINMSYGSDASVKGDDNLYKKAVEKASENGILCVNSAGNSQVSTTKSTKKYPSNYSGIKDTSIVDNSTDVTFTVASMDMFYTMSNFSSWGPSTNLELKPEITALGENVRSTANDNEYAILSGTSMAAPYVSGSEALIYEAVNNKFPNIDITKKTEFVKNMAMNTADVLYDGDEPYSPRWQGAGAINIKNAINNNVLVTDNRGKASLALKNIGKETSFSMIVKNYGNDATSYKINNDIKLYSEIVLSNKKIEEVEIENAKITFDTEYINVSGNSEVIVKGTITLPNSFDENNFVEGYIKLASLDTNVPSLSIPLLAFYGDYGSETILDSPIYDNDSIFKETGLGSRSGSKFEYYGKYYDEDEKEELVDPNLVAFSPNNDGLQDTVSLNNYFLRNAKCYEIEVLDKDKNFIGNKMIYYNVVKNSYNDSSGNKSRQLQYYYNWDGTKYNMSTGSFDKVEDGQYYIRAKTIGYTDNAKEQVIDMPVKVDTVSPIVSNVYIDRINEDEEILYKLNWSATDEFSKVKCEAEYFLNDNDNSKTEIENIENNGHNYSGYINLNKGQINKITLIIKDYAGNETEFNYTYNAEGDKDIDISTDTPDDKPEMVDALSFSKLKQNLVLNVGAGRFKIKGYMRSDVYNILINEEEAVLGDGTFEKTVILADGDNIVNVKAYSKDNEEIFNKDYNVTLDRENPVIESIWPDASKKVYATEDDTFKLNVKGKDISKLVCKIENDLTGEEVSESLDDNGEGEIEVPLKSGLNKLNLELVDEANNSSETMELLVVKVSDKNKLNVGFVNIENSQSTAGNVDSEGCINVIGYVTKIPKVLKINDTDVLVNDDFTFSHKVKLIEGLNKVKIYAEDEYGNVVEEYAYRLYYDNEAPVIDLDIDFTNIDGDFYTNRKKFILKGSVHDNKSDYKVFLNGNMITNTQTGMVGFNDNDLINDFSYEYTLNAGDNYFRFRTVDKFGNDNTTIVKVVYFPLDGEEDEPETSDNSNFIIYINCIILLYVYKKIKKYIHNY